jgi:hypothetical protein
MQQGKEYLDTKDRNGSGIVLVKNNSLLGSSLI